MVFAEDIRKTILKLAEERGPNHSFEPLDVAKRVNGDNFHDLLEQIRFVALVLVKEGKITTNITGDEAETAHSFRFRKTG